MKIILGIIIGSLVGYGYHKLVGCSTGACPIVKNQWASILYGAIMGLAFTTLL